MENARRGVTYRAGSPKKPLNTRTPPRTLTNGTSSDKESTNMTRVANKENIIDKKSKPETCKDISKRMDELAAFARESLARVEALANRTKESLNANKHPRQDAKLSSILKKKSVEEAEVEPPAHHFSLPVSILKRKVSQDEAAPSHVLPVTFSPSVVEPATTNRKQGILKKRRSLDESQVLRHRSCSPDVANTSEARSILKNQRRSSLEEIARTSSPDLQGILKRKSSRHEEDLDHSLNSPQGILKRRSGASSAGSSSTTSHVSITTAVILAAAGGAEMVLDQSPEAVKPILKKKSFSDERPSIDSSCETPKPILKKKSSTDTDDSEEKPKKPILKTPRYSLDGSEEINASRLYHHQNSTDSSTERDVKPILKQNSVKLTLPEDESPVVRRSRRPNTICTANISFTGRASVKKEEDASLRRPRPLSVSELVMSFEKNPDSSTGAVPKRSSFKRNSERYRTQPVTFNELEAR